MADILKVWRQIENPTPSIDAYVYLKNIVAKFHPDPIETTKPLGFLKRSPQQEQQQEQQDE